MIADARRYLPLPSGFERSSGSLPAASPSGRHALCQRWAPTVAPHPRRPVFRASAAVG